MQEEIVIYLQQTVKVACDANCAKAWGLNSRPVVQVEEGSNETEWVADDEFESAPDDPGTYEGGHAKPNSPTEFPNKWCVRECERCLMAKPDETLSIEHLPDWTKRVKRDS